jgi:hypothetical protein
MRCKFGLELLARALLSSLTVQPALVIRRGAGMAMARDAKTMQLLFSSAGISVTWPLKLRRAPATAGTASS